MPDGSSSMQPASRSEHRVEVSADAAKCGIVLIGHGNTASTMLDAARSIMPDCLPGAIAVDAGCGETPELTAKICAVIEKVDEGRGILLLADLMGSSPCMCGIRESTGHSEHGVALVTGLNLAMLTKLAVADRHADLCVLAEACADSARRSVCVKIQEPEA
jgi:PTS system mannose-specific IIA component